MCLFDGEARKMLHRHIRSKYDMSPEEYRAYWDLPADYPMIAPGYSEEKRIVAVAQGLGPRSFTKPPRRASSPARPRRPCLLNGCAGRPDPSDAIGATLGRHTIVPDLPEPRWHRYWA